MGKALDRGMVLVLSLFDDYLAHMLWLDSATGTGDDDESKPGVLRGPCKTISGVPSEVRAMHGSASVKYTNFMYGEIGSTLMANMSGKPQATETKDKTYLKELKSWSSPAASQ